MDDWDCDDEIDWLAGEYTYKKERLKRQLRHLESRCNDCWDEY